MKIIDALLGQLFGLALSIGVILVAVQSTIGLETLINMFQSTQQMFDMISSASGNMESLMSSIPKP